MNKIVVGFADVETAHHVVREAVDLAHRLGASLHVVTAVSEDATTTVDIGSDYWVLSSTDLAEEGIGNLMRKLTHSVDYTVAVHEGKPADVLVEEAERVGADLIMVGNVRMQGPSRLLGSVGGAVAHHAPCSVLIVKST